MRALVWLTAVAVVAAAPPPARTTVTVVAFSDYHAHARPFFSEGRPGQGGLARAIAALKAIRAKGPTIAVSGGDMLNAGAPLWSDDYRCRDWPWFDGLLDAMAVGNHDLDYGREEFQRCVASVAYPVLSANLVGADGAPVLRANGKPYLVKEVGGVRIGLLAVASADVQNLIRKDRLPEGARWADATATARAAVAALRGEEKADAVVLIGHGLREEDEALVRAVPGIDLVLGTHSHHKSGLERIQGTSAWYVAPYQYLTYLSEVRLTFEGRRLVDVAGGLVALDETKPEDPEVAARVAALQKDLETRHPDRFRLIGRLAEPLDDTGIETRLAPIGTWATERLRRAVGAHAFVATASGFRGGLPAGDVTVEDFLNAMPYSNRLVVAGMTGAQVRELVALSRSQAGSGHFSQMSGLRDGPGGALEILRDPADPAKGFAPLTDGGAYRIGTSDYQSGVSRTYKDFFAKTRVTPTTSDAHTVLQAAIAGDGAAAR